MFGRIDWDDRIAGAVFLLSSALSVELVLPPAPLGFINDSLFTLGSGTAAVAFSMAQIVALVALVATIITNRTDFSKLNGIEMWAAIVTVGLVIAPPFVPLLREFLQSSMIAGGFSVVLQAGGFGIISYLG